MSSQSHHQDTKAGRIYASHLSVRDKLYFLYQITSNVFSGHAAQDESDPDGQSDSIKRNIQDSAIADAYIKRLQDEHQNDKEFAVFQADCMADRYRPSVSNLVDVFGDSDDEEYDFLMEDIEPVSSEAPVVEEARVHNSGVVKVSPPSSSRVIPLLDLEPQIPAPRLVRAPVPNPIELLGDGSDDGDDEMNTELRSRWVHLAVAYYNYASVDEFDRRHGLGRQFEDPVGEALSGGFRSIRAYLVSQLGPQRVREIEQSNYRGVRRPREDGDVSTRPRSVRRLTQDEPVVDDPQMRSVMSASLTDQVLNVVSQKEDHDMLSAAFGPGQVRVRCKYGFCNRWGSASDFVPFRPIGGDQGSLCRTSDGSVFHHEFVFYCHQHAPDRQFRG